MLGPRHFTVGDGDEADMQTSTRPKKIWGGRGEGRMARNTRMLEGKMEVKSDPVQMDLQGGHVMTSKSVIL